MLCCAVLCCEFAKQPFQITYVWQVCYNVILVPFQVFKGLKNDVQQVAIKVIDQTDAQQLADFAQVILHISLWNYILSDRSPY